MVVRYSVTHLLATGCTFYPADVWHPDWLHFWFEKNKNFQIPMTFVPSEDYSQSPSFMDKGSRNSVKKKSVKPVLLRVYYEPLHNETPENERHSWP